MEWFEKEHKIKAEVGVVELDPDDGMSIIPDGSKIIKRWCPDCAKVKDVQFPIVCVCGGLIHSEEVYIWEEYEVRFKCNKCESTYSYEGWYYQHDKHFAKMDLLFRKNLLVKNIKDSFYNDETKRKMIEHLDRIYYNSPKINYSEFK